LAGEIRTKYRFDADALGVSKITLTDAINITNNDLEVNLNGLVLPPLGTLLLFDGDQALAGNRVFGTFANLTVDGVVEAPNGAHFTSCAPDYERDEAFQREYAKSAASAEAWAEFKSAWLDLDEAGYQAKVASR
jgi:hypothetical protein